MYSVFVRYPCMAINDIVLQQYTSVFFSPQHFSVYPSPYILVWFDSSSTVIDIISTILVIMYYYNSGYVGLLLVAVHGD